MACSPGHFWRSQWGVADDARAGCRATKNEIGVFRLDKRTRRQMLLGDMSSIGAIWSTGGIKDFDNLDAVPTVEELAGESIGAKKNERHSRRVTGRRKRVALSILL